MPEQKMKITEKAFSDYTGQMCHVGFTHSISNEPLSERQQNRLAACLEAVPFTPSEPVQSDSTFAQKDKTSKSAGNASSKKATSNKVTETPEA
ncbi:hypothetical protein OH773_21760 (plasmid) [Buttiauxella sp. WJP83]|uniref:hypothetical protein n=1 Tax=Buttiauxella sp. WJP83 TaxID=2986951 RepID=UPI0022DDBC31|nr:hypothetical protein [Buttiauxella sp. WJP83]WBM72992.1 hypothetical protein OH773_21760 [Buttiauxella sp. WJP83]